jgi:hypothetical protein
MRHHDSIVVWLRSAGSGFLTFPKRASLDVAATWPLPGTVPFPEGDVADVMQELLQQPDAELERLWVELALEQGIDADGIDARLSPWAAVLAMEVERRWANLDQADAYAEAKATGVLAPGDEMDPDLLLGPPANEGVLRLAEDLIESHPDSMAAEYARLYQLDALINGDGDPGEARAVATDMLHHTDDALVAGQAVSLLSRLGRGEQPLGVADLDALGALVDDFPESLEALDVAAYALDEAMRRDDGARTRGWTERLEDAVARVCGARRSPRCDTHRDNLDDVHAYIGDRQAWEADTWKQAVALAAYACAREGHAWRVPEGHRVVAVHDGGWSFGPWSPGSAYSSCVQRGVAEGPAPERDGVLEVRVAIVM